MSKSEEYKKNRNSVIDFSRFIAIFAMIITHVIAIMYSYNADDSAVYWIGVIGGTISFTLFLFLSGASMYLSYITIPNSYINVIKEKRKKIIFRTIEILGVYYFLAFLSAFVANTIFQNTSVVGVCKDIIKILFFFEVPAFTEFLLAFILFNILVIIFRFFFVRILKSSIITTLFGIGLYGIGYFLYTIPINIDFADNIKALFVGHEALHTFPIFQYSIVYLLGMVYATYSENRENIPNLFFKRNLTIVVTTVTLILGALFGAITLAFDYLKINEFDSSVYSGRFPPTIGFIVLSLFLSMIIMSVGTILEKQFSKQIQKLFKDVSKYTISFFAIHTFLLLSLKYILDNLSEAAWELTSFLQVLLVFIGVVLMCSVIIFVVNKISLFIKEIDEEWIIRKSGMVAISVLGIIAVVILGYTVNTVKPIQIANASEFTKVSNIDNNAEMWIDDSFTYYRHIIAPKNNSDSKVTLSVLIDERKSDEIITSYKVYSLDFSGSSLEVTTSQFIDENGSVHITFDSTNNYEYYLYYNLNETVSVLSEESDPVPEGVVGAELGEPITHKFTIELSHSWYLVEYPDQGEITMSIIDGESLEDVVYISYQIIGTEIQGELAENELKAILPIESLSVGNYKVQATVYAVENGQINVYKTAEEPLWISYPLYVSWSLDWEGYGVNEGDLNEIVAISDEYQMPITQFFNPRIYVENQYSTYEVNSGAASYYTNWVLNRRNNKGDEIGLHIHMYPDLLEEIGVEVNEDAKIIGIARDETYLQGYDYDELTQVIEWSLEKFKENGITNVTSFRSGAWMSSPTLLKVLADQGFKVDSSGRTAGLLNPNQQGSTPIPWNLPANVKPYKPNVYNMNSWVAPKLNIWEFANNGADSYWFSGENLIERLNLNYPTLGAAMESPQAVVYLSHPHGFVAYDSEKIRSLLAYAEKFAYKNDNGPIVYETIGDIYNLWNKTLFINGQ